MCVDSTATCALLQTLQESPRENAATRRYAINQAEFGGEKKALSVTTEML